MKYQDLIPVVLTNDEVAAIKTHQNALTIMVQRSNVVIIKVKNTIALFRGFCTKYPKATITDPKVGTISIKISIGSNQIDLYRGWVLKSIRDVLLEDIGNAYAGDIKILPAQMTDTGTPYIWRIRAGTKEHLIWRTDDHISDIRRACDSGQHGIRVSVEAGFKLWNSAIVRASNIRDIGDITVTQNLFTNAYFIKQGEKEVVTDSLIELFFTIYTFSLNQTQPREFENHWAESIHRETLTH